MGKEKIHIVKEGQSLLDVALQSTGSMESLIAIACANDIPVDAELTTEQVLTIPQDARSVRKVQQSYQINDTVPATSYTLYDKALNKGGIGFMFIGGTFKVS